MQNGEDPAWNHSLPRRLLTAALTCDLRLASGIYPEELQSMPIKFQDVLHVASAIALNAA